METIANVVSGCNLNYTLLFTDYAYSLFSCIVCTMRCAWRFKFTSLLKSVTYVVLLLGWIHVLANMYGFDECQ